MIKRWFILTLGWAVVIVGLILIPLPGPGVLAILAGLAILSLKSAWARWMLLRCKSYIRSRWPDLHAQLERFHCGIRRWNKISIESAARTPP
ncbi:MAG: PGPGW domain-containing protein [Thermodesulfobacteriota bacterium]